MNTQQITATGDVVPKDRGSLLVVLWASTTLIAMIGWLFGLGWAALAVARLITG
jgi:hypothetical protein